MAEDPAQSCMQLASNHCCFLKISPGGQWSIILVRLAASEAQATFIKHQLCTRHLTRWYERYKDWGEASCLQVPMKNPEAMLSPFLP